MQTSTSTQISPGWRLVELTTGRTATRARWAANFQGNKERFADEVAKSIAKEVFANFKALAESPYVGYPTTFLHSGSRATPHLIFSFEIWDKETVLKIKNWAKETATLSPFNEWMANFEGEQPSEFVDKEYFMTQMDVIGKLVAKQLKTIFASAMKEKGNHKLSIKCDYYENGICHNPDRPEGYIAVAMEYL